MLSSLSDPSPARKMVRKTLTHFEGIFGRQIKAINTIGKYRKHGRKLSQWVWYHQISATAQWRCSQFGRRVGSEVSGKQGQVESFCGRQSSLGRSEEHTSELQSLMRISYAVFCLKKK